MCADAVPAAWRTSTEGFHEAVHVENVRRRHRGKQNVPLEERIQEFFEKLKELKSRHREERTRSGEGITQGVRGIRPKSDQVQETHTPGNTNKLCNPNTLTV